MHVASPCIECTLRHHDQFAKLLHSVNISVRHVPQFAWLSCLSCNSSAFVMYLPFTWRIVNTVTGLRSGASKCGTSNI